MQWEHFRNIVYNFNAAMLVETGFILAWPNDKTFWEDGIMKRPAILQKVGTKRWIHCVIPLLVKTKNVCSFASLHKNWMNLLAKQIVQCSKSASLLPSRGNSGEWHLSWVRKSGWFQWNINECWWPWYLEVHFKTSKCKYFPVTSRLVSRIMAKEQ